MKSINYLLAIGNLIGAIVNLFVGDETNVLMCLIIALASSEEIRFNALKDRLKSIEKVNHEFAKIVCKVYEPEEDK